MWSAMFLSSPPMRRIASGSSAELVRERATAPRRSLIVAGVGAVWPARAAATAAVTAAWMAALAIGGTEAERGSGVAERMEVSESESEEEESSSPLLESTAVLSSSRLSRMIFPSTLWGREEEGRASTFYEAGIIFGGKEDAFRTRYMQTIYTRPSLSTICIRGWSRGAHVIRVLSRYGVITSMARVIRKSEESAADRIRPRA